MAWFRRSGHLEDELSAYVDGELGERARRAVETHLASCEACSTLLIELQDTKQLLSELPRPEPRRSLTLGPEFAAERRVAPPPRRPAFTFAPAVALTLLVALLFVDATGLTEGTNGDEAGFTTASRALDESEAATGLAAAAPESGGEQASAPEAADAAAPGDGGALGGASATADDGPESNAGLLVESTPEPEPREALPRAADDDSNADEPEALPLETSRPADADDSSDGVSTLRILEIAAAFAFASSLLAVFLPRIMGRQEG